MTADRQLTCIREVIRRRLEDPAVELSVLQSVGSSSTYLATSGGRRWFVKFPDESARMYPLLEAGADCPFLVKSAFRSPVPFADGYLTCLEWRPAEVVHPERWSDDQLESFMAAYAEFARILQRTDDVGTPEDDSAFFAVIEDYVRHHPIRAFLLRPLLAIPGDERTYRAGEARVVTHGDLHSRNYGFKGSRFECFYDVDNILWGLAPDDLAYTVLDRAQRLSLGARDFGRCVAVLRRLVARFGGSPREWRLCINRKRIRQAARKIAKRPHSILPALDIVRHDRRAVRLMRAAGFLP